MNAIFMFLIFIRHLQTWALYANRICTIESFIFSCVGIILSYNSVITSIFCYYYYDYVYLVEICIIIIAIAIPLNSFIW